MRTQNGYLESINKLCDDTFEYRLIATPEDLPASYDRNVQALDALMDATRHAMDLSEEEDRQFRQYFRGAPINDDKAVWHICLAWSCPFECNGLRSRSLTVRGDVGCWEGRF